jgi:hypothetical protein
MTTFHGPTRTATIDRRKLLVTTEDGEIALCSSLSQATALALAHIAAPKPTPLHTALIRAMAGATTWRD